MIKKSKLLIFSVILSIFFFPTHTHPYSSIFSLYPPSFSHSTLFLSQKPLSKIFIILSKFIAKNCIFLRFLASPGNITVNFCFFDGKIFHWFLSFLKRLWHSQTPIQNEHGNLQWLIEAWLEISWRRWRSSLFSTVSPQQQHWMVQLWLRHLHYSCLEVFRYRYLSFSLFILVYSYFVSI